MSAVNKFTRLQLIIKSVDKMSIQLYSDYLKRNLTKANIDYTFTGLPTTFKRISLLKSPHVHKKAFEQFELRKYKNLFTLKLGKDQNYFYSFIINKPKTVNVKLQKFE